MGQASNVTMHCECMQLIQRHITHNYCQQSTGRGHWTILLTLTMSIFSYIPMCGKHNYMPRVSVELISTGLRAYRYSEVC